MGYPPMDLPIHRGLVFPPLIGYRAPRGLRQDPSCTVESLGSARFLADPKILRNGRSKMRLMLRMYGARRNTQTLLGLGVQVRALAVAEECNAPVATGVMPTREWQ